MNRVASFLTVVFFCSLANLSLCLPATPGSDFHVPIVHYSERYLYKLPGRKEKLPTERWLDDHGIRFYPHDGCVQNQEKGASKQQAEEDLPFVFVRVWFGATSDRSKFKLISWGVTSLSEKERMKVEPLIESIEQKGYIEASPFIVEHLKGEGLRPGEKIPCTSWNFAQALCLAFWERGFVGWPYSREKHEPVCSSPYFMDTPWNVLVKKD